jgi:hypothetical protein
MDTELEKSKRAAQILFFMAVAIFIAGLYNYLNS